MNKNIIIAGAIAIGLYLFSQQKKISYIATAKKTTKTVAERAAAERAAEKAAFTAEVKRKISTLSAAEKIQALVAYRKKIAAEKKVAPQAISLVPAVRAKVLVAVAEKKAAKKIAEKIKPKPILRDYLSKKKKKTTGTGFNFDPWPVKAEPQKKSTLFDYSKPKKKKDLSKLKSAIKWRKTPAKKKVARKVLAKRKIIQKILARKKVAPIMPKKWQKTGKKVAPIMPKK